MVVLYGGIFCVRRILCIESDNKKIVSLSKNKHQRGTETPFQVSGNTHKNQTTIFSQNSVFRLDTDQSRHYIRLRVTDLCRSVWELYVDYHGSNCSYDRYFQ